MYLCILFAVVIILPNVVFGDIEINGEQRVPVNREGVYKEKNKQTAEKQNGSYYHQAPPVDAQRYAETKERNGSTLNESRPKTTEYRGEKVSDEVRVNNKNRSNNTTYGQAAPAASEGYNGDNKSNNNNKDASSYEEKLSETLDKIDSKESFQKKDNNYEYMGPEEIPERYDEGKVYSHEGGDVSDKLIEEWETHMTNFVPEMLVTFFLQARTSEYFYKDVEGEEGEGIRGGYFISVPDGDSGIEFTVTNPAHEIVLKKTDPEALFHFEATMKGTYSFAITNKKWVNKRSVTFAIGPGMKSTLQPSHLVSLDDNIERLQTHVRDIQTQSQILNIRKKKQLSIARLTQNKILYFSIATLVILITLSAGQIYYIKSLVSDRRVL